MKQLAFADVMSYDTVLNTHLPLAARSILLRSLMEHSHSTDVQRVIEPMDEMQDVPRPPAERCRSVMIRECVSCGTSWLNVQSPPRARNLLRISRDR